MKKTKITVFLLMLAVLLIALPACSQNEEVVSTDTNMKMDNEKKPTLDASAQVKGKQAIITIQTSLHISKEMYGKEKHYGQGHIHMYVDQGKKQVVFSTEPIVLQPLSPGVHTVKISLHNNDHTPYNVTKTLVFTVR